MVETEARWVIVQLGKEVLTTTHYLSNLFRRTLGEIR